MKVKKFFQWFFFWTSPIATVLGMVLLGMYSSQQDIGNAMWSGMLIVFGWGGALAVGYFDGENAVMHKIRKNAERFHRALGKPRKTTRAPIRKGLDK